MPVEHLTKLRNRADLGTILNKRFLNGHAVELGVHRGYFSQAFLLQWNAPGFLYGIDSYESDYDEGDPAAKGDREDDYHEALKVCERFPERMEIRVTTGVEAANDFPDGSLDMVYVDAKHRYQDVLEDLTTWWPKVKPTGLLAGHDIVCPGEENGGWGAEIKPAVHEFADSIGKDVYLIRERGMPWSYYITK